MLGIESIAKGIVKKFGIPFECHKDVVQNDSVFSDGKSVTSDGKQTYFRFFYGNEPYVGILKGVGQTERNYAGLLPTYISSFEEKDNELSRTEFLKKILLGERSPEDVYKYVLKYSVKGSSCFAIALYVEKGVEESRALIAQYVGCSVEEIVRFDDKTCAFVKFVGDEEGDYSSVTDYTVFLAQFLTEELGGEVTAGVGTTVSGFQDVAVSYMQATTALRYADVFGEKGVHSYKEYMLVKMLEDLPKTRLNEYFESLTDEEAMEIFEDEEMLNTAENFLNSSLNVSETSRNLYMHRNTLLYRLDKIEKATGLNIRQFSDAVSFRVLSILHKLLK